MLQIWEQVRYSAQVESKAAPNLRVSFTPGVWDSVDLGWAPRIQEAAPALKLHIEKAVSTEIFQGLHRGQIDVGFTVEPHAAEDLKSDLFLEAQLRLYSNQPNQKPEHIVERGYIHVNWGTSFTSQFLSHYPDYLQSTITVSTARIAADLLQHLPGMFYAPVAFVEKVQSQQTLYLVPDAPVFNLSIYVSRLLSNPKSSLIERLLSAFDSNLIKINEAA